MENFDPNSPTLFGSELAIKLNESYKFCTKEFGMNHVATFIATDERGTTSAR